MAVANIWDALPRDARTPAGIVAWLHEGGLGSQRRLDLRWMDFGPGDLGLLLAVPDVARITALNLGANTLGDAGATILAGSSALHGLKQLDLYGNGIGAEGAAALARSPHLSALESLHLDFNPIGPDGLLALLSSSHLAGLVELTLGSCAIGVRGAKYLAN